MQTPINHNRGIYDWKSYQKRKKTLQIIKAAATKKPMKNMYSATHAEFYRWRLMNEREQQVKKRRFILLFKIIPLTMWFGLALYVHSVGACLISGAALFLSGIDVVFTNDALSNGPFEFFFYIENDDEDIDELKDLCKENCKGRWNFQTVGHLPMFSFELEADAAMFKMFRV